MQQQQQWQWWRILDVDVVVVVDMMIGGVERGMLDRSDGFASPWLRSSLAGGKVKNVEDSTLGRRGLFSQTLWGATPFDASICE